MAQSISVPAARCWLPEPPGKVPVDRVLHLVVALPSPWEWMWRLGVLNIPLTGRGSFNGMLPYPLPWERPRARSRCRAPPATTKALCE